MSAGDIAHRRKLLESVQRLVKHVDPEVADIAQALDAFSGLLSVWSGEHVLLEVVTVSADGSAKRTTLPTELETVTVSPATLASDMLNGHATWQREHIVATAYLQLLHRG